MAGSHSDNEPLCAVSDIGPEGREARVEDDAGPRWLMLFHRDGELSAWQNVCPHQGRALNWAPNRFLFSAEGHLVCSHHGATFELSAGECVAGPCRGARLKPVDITVRDGRVYLGEHQGN